MRFPPFSLLNTTAGDAMLNPSNSRQATSPTLSVTPVQCMTTRYSHNWAGAVLENPPSTNSTYNEASTIFAIPTPLSINPELHYQAASIWVGIDGASSSTNVILQSGIDVSISEGNNSIKAWYQWYPDDSVPLDLNLHAGDEVAVSVAALAGGKQGTCTIENRSTGEKATATLGAPLSTATLKGETVEWIVEDYQAGGLSERVNLVDFGDIEFS